MSVVVIVGTAKGAAFLRSDSSRTRWEIEGLRMKGWVVTAATQDDGGRYYVGVTSPIFGAAILVSDDLEKWRQIEKGPRYTGEPGNEAHNRIIGQMDPIGMMKPGIRYLDQIWKLHAIGDVVYAGVSEAGIFRSRDRGESWQPLEGFNDQASRPDWGPGAGGLCLHTLLVDGRNPDRIWCGVSATGAFRSEDGGQTWTDANEGVSKSEGYCVHSMTHDPNDADVIYRQDHRGMYRTRDGGRSWESIENGLPVAELSDGRRCVFGFPIAMDPHTKAVYAIPLEGDGYRFPHGGALRVYRTTNGGESWEPLSSGLPDGDTFTSILRGAMSVDGLDPCGVYFGTSSGTVYASNDRGDSWIQIPCTLPRIFCVEAFQV